MYDNKKNKACGQRETSISAEGDISDQYLTFLAKPMRPDTSL